MNLDNRKYLKYIKYINVLWYNNMYKLKIIHYIIESLSWSDIVGEVIGETYGMSYDNFFDEKSSNLANL